MFAPGEILRVEPKAPLVVVPFREILQASAVRSHYRLDRRTVNFSKDSEGARKVTTTGLQLARFMPKTTTGSDCLQPPNCRS